MTGAERLFFLLGEVDDAFVEEAAHPVAAVPKREFHWKRWAALAAGLVLVIGLARILPLFGGMGSTDGAALPSTNGAGAAAPNASAVPEAEEPQDGAPDYGLSDADPGSAVAPTESAEVPDVGGTATILPYDLTSNEITVYTPAPDLWITTQVVDRAAKRLCTILTISDPEPAVQPSEIPIAWLDMGNGTVVGLFSGDYAVVYSCDGRFDPNFTGSLVPHLQGAFPGLDDTLSKVLENPAEAWSSEEIAAAGDLEDTPVLSPADSQ